MTSYHEYNKIEKGRKLTQLLLEGKDIALITDAGTPGISDPGEELVRMCQEAGITVTAVPGRGGLRDCPDDLRAAHQAVRLRGVPPLGQEGAQGDAGGAGRTRRGPSCSTRRPTAW